jgi:hypothetical protein
MRDHRFGCTSPFPSATPFATSKSMGWRQAVTGLVGGLLLTAASLHAAPASAFVRSGKLEWTRLDTGTKYWDRHAEYDDELLTSMRRHTTLDIDRVWQATRPNDMEKLCSYPFVYSDNIAPLSKADAKNVAEYLRRGGFLLIDACGNSQINPDPVRFFDQQVAVLRNHFPNLRVKDLDPRHELFSIYFKMKEFPPKARPGSGGSWLDSRDFPLRGIYVEDRMIAIISLSGLQCGWAHYSRIPVAMECMQMVANIYVYAMTR